VFIEEMAEKSPVETVLAQAAYFISWQAKWRIVQDARRSEIRRALITDFDFDTRTVLIREKKKDREKVETYRTVPMSPLLVGVMRDWFANHPGGRHAVCTGVGGSSPLCLAQPPPSTPPKTESKAA
jgi:integrase